MTFENHKQLTDISKMPGYSVDLVNGKTGMFDPQGNEVDPATVNVDPVLKIVIGYEKVGGPVSTHQATERDDLIRKCEMLGMRVDRRWSTQKIKEVLSRSRQAPEGTLAVG
jgi:hypothetical protein